MTRTAEFPPHASRAGGCTRVYEDFARRLGCTTTVSRWRPRLKYYNTETGELTIPTRHPVVQQLLDRGWPVYCNLRFERPNTRIAFSAKPPAGRLVNGRDKWHNVEAALSELARDAGITGLGQSDPSSLRSAPEILE